MSEQLEEDARAIIPDFRGVPTYEEALVMVLGAIETARSMDSLAEKLVTKHAIRAVTPPPPTPEQASKRATLDRAR